MNLNKRTVIDLCIIFILITIFCSGLFAEGLPFGGDTLLFTVWLDFYKKHHLWFYSWTSLGSFGGPISFGVPFNLVIMLFALVPGAIFATKLWLYFIFLFAGVTMYHFVHHHTKHCNASLIAAIIFMFNPIFLTEVYEGHMDLIFGYAFAPLLFITYNKSLESGKLQHIILAAIAFLLFFVAGHPQTTYIFGTFLILFTVFEVLVPRGEMNGRLEALKRAVKVSMLVTTFSLLFLAYTVLPMILGVMPTIVSALGYTLEETYFYSSKSFLDAFILPSYGHSVNPILAPIPFEIIKYALRFAVPLIAFSTIVLRRNRLTLFFITSSLISAFVAKGPYPPLGEGFIWAFINIPLFNIFRVPSRWLIMTAFSYAFLAGIATKELVKLSENPKHKFFNSISKLIHFRAPKTLAKFNSRIVLAIIILVVFLNSAWIMYNIDNPYYLGTYTLYNSYVEPYEWIRLQQGDFRILTTPYGVVNVYVKTSMISDVADGDTWDPGFYSQTIHGKVAVFGRGWETYTADFQQFVQNAITHASTNDLMKILGAFNVKYVVVQPHTSEGERKFWSGQEGLTNVYRSDDASVMENEFWTPHILPVSKYAIVVGGREAFTALTTLDNFDLSDWSLLFADQIVNQLGADQLLKLLNESPLLIFVNSEPLDLAMFTLENAIKIKAVDYAYPSTNKYEHWISDDWWTSMGMHVLNRRLLLTSGNLSLSIPVNVENSGEYDIWIRLLYGESRGNLSVKIDTTELGNILPYARHYSGLRWTKIGSARLEQGQHDVTLTNNKSTIEWAQGESANIDEILLVKPQEFKLAINKTNQLLQQSPARIISIIEGEQMFKWATTPHFTEWWTARQPFNASGGWVASTTSENTWIPLKYSILRDGRYNIALRIMVGPDQGTLRIFIDDTEYLLNATSQEPAFRWITFAPITLQSGNHTFDLYGEGKVEIDQIVIYSLNQNEDEITLGDIFKTDKPQTTISYEMINPTMYTVHVETDTPFFLVFSDAYHNLWKAYIDGEETQSIPAYSFVNTFQISKTGEYDIIVEFIGQRYVVYGGIISITSITLAVIYLMFGVKINKFIVRKLKLKQKKKLERNGVEQK